MYQIIHLLLTIITFFSSALDTYFYPGFCQTHFKISADVILIIYLSLSLILSALKVKLYPNFFKKINNKIIFPFLLIGYIAILFLEKHFYANFVFSTFHLHRLIFLNLVAISGTIFYITFPKFKNQTHQTIYLLMPLLLILSYPFFLYSEYTLFYKLTKEDGLLENIQPILYLLAGIYSLKTSTRFFRSNKPKFYGIFFALLSLGLFFNAGEEISWGQRIFNIQTPEKYQAINAQKEITIHNLDFIQHHLLHWGYILVSLYGMLSRPILRKFFPKKYHQLSIFTFPFSTIFAFFCVFSFYILIDHFQYLYLLSQGPRANFIISQEIGETYLSFAFLIYTLEIYRSKPKTSKIVA